MSNIVCGVYWIRNIVTGHIYIGASKNIIQRIYVHFSSLRHGRHKNGLLQYAYNGYGEENFRYKVLITCDTTMLLWYEQQFLDQWKPEYNMYHFAGSAKGNKHNLGRIHTEDTRKRMSESQKGKKYTDATRKKMSESQKGNKSHLGHTHTEEWKHAQAERTKQLPRLPNGRFA